MKSTSGWVFLVGCCIRKRARNTRTEHAVGRAAHLIEMQATIHTDIDVLVGCLALHSPNRTVSFFRAFNSHRPSHPGEQHLCPSVYKAVRKVRAARGSLALNVANDI